MAFYLSGRVIVYTNQVPFETDVLRTNDYNMAGDSGLAATILGLGVSNVTMVSGLPCAPISPPGLSVVIGPGRMYSYEDYDATDYGVIPADTNPNHKLYKQAFNWDDVTLSTPAPATPGDSIIYLVQGIFDTVDVNNVSRPYFNSADPTMPIFNNNYDTRYDKILLSVKAGTPSPSPTPPTPDAGYTGLWYVTIANGQTSVISGNIVKVSTVEGQPFITESLVQKVSSATVASGFVSIPAQQKNTYVYGTDVGSLNSIQVNPATTYPSYVPGTYIEVLISNTNTSASTLNINGLGAIPIRVPTVLGLKPTVGNEMVAGIISKFIFDGTYAQLQNPLVTPSVGATIYKSTTQNIPGNNTQTLITFDSADSDPYGFFQSGNSSLQPTVKGEFLITSGIRVVGNGQTVQEFQTTLYLNGSPYAYLSGAGEQSGVNNFTFNGSKKIRLNTTDYIQLYALANNVPSGTASPISGGVLNNYFEITYLGS